MLFVTRTRGFFLKPPYPAWLLSIAIIGTQIFAMLMCGFGWLVPAIPWSLIGLVWAYNAVWMFIQDFVKLTVYRMSEEKAGHHKSFLGLLNQHLHSHCAYHHQKVKVATN